MPVSTPKPPHKVGDMVTITLPTDEVKLAVVARVHEDGVLDLEVVNTTPLTRVAPEHVKKV